MSEVTPEVTPENIQTTKADEANEANGANGVKQEKQLLKIELPEQNLDLNSIFISDDNTFECTLNFKKDGNKYLIESMEEYFTSQAPSAKIVFTCKYPAVKEFQAIMAASKSGGQFTPQDITLMELSRLYSIIKTWNLPKNLSEIVNISPILVKGMLNKVQENIGLDGII